jgi:hypothetical protein
MYTIAATLFETSTVNMNVNVIAIAIAWGVLPYPTSSRRARSGTRMTVKLYRRHLIGKISNTYGNPLEGSEKRSYSAIPLGASHTQGEKLIGRGFSSERTRRVDGAQSNLISKRTSLPLAHERGPCQHGIDGLRRVQIGGVEDLSNSTAIEKMRLLFVDIIGLVCLCKMMTNAMK